MNYNATGTGKCLLYYKSNFWKSLLFAKYGNDKRDHCNHERTTSHYKKSDDVSFTHTWAFSLNITDI